MNDLEKIAEQEKKLKEKKKKALAKEYEKLGRKFYKKSKFKSFDDALKTLENQLTAEELFEDYDGGSFSSEVIYPSNQTDQWISEQDLATLQHFANELKWQESGQYWRTDDIKGLTNFIAKFRTEN